jgi:hypothetical protein
MTLPWLSISPARKAVWLLRATIQVCTQVLHCTPPVPQLIVVPPAVWILQLLTAAAQASAVVGLTKKGSSAQK